MFRKKIYGQSKEESCAFCGKTALSKNPQGLPVCTDHIKNILEGKKCACGEMMEVKESKWGAFFLCKNCGPISLKKAKEDVDNSDYNINKKYRKKSVDVSPKKQEQEEGKEKIYTLDELKELWNDE
jgi:hypothetical protein